MPVPEDTWFRATWLHGRGEALGRMAVAAKSELAASAGARAFEIGGNAYDAAVAALLASGVSQPYSTSVAGGGVMVGSGPQGVQGVDFRYRAPSDLSAAPAVSATGSKGLLGHAGPFERGGLSIAVPGSMAGVDFIRTLGSVPLPEAAVPAIDAARHGVPVSYYDSIMDAYLLRNASSDATARRLLYNGMPHLPRLFGAGDVRRQVELADTIEQLADDPRQFYDGSLARVIGDELRDLGSLVTHDDLAQFTVRGIGNHLALDYAGNTVYSAPHACLALLMLATSQELGLGRYEHGSPDWVAGWLATVAACRWLEIDVLDDRWYAALEADQSTWTSTVANLAERAEAHAAGRARSDERGPRQVRGEELGGTVAICVADQDGTMVALTDTVLSYFGSMEVSSLGFTYNNGMFGFAPPGRSNALVAGAAPLSNMSPLVVQGPTVPGLAVSASGGRAISAAVAQVVSAVVDHGLTAQAAVDAPRVDLVSHAVVDSRLAQSARHLGHRFEVEVVSEDLTSAYFANVVALERTRTGSYRTGVNSHHPAFAFAIA